MKIFKAFRIRYFIYTLILLIFLSCSDDGEVNIELDEYDLEVISYFKDIALGFEYGTSSEITRKWCSDLKIFVGGDISNDFRSIVFGSLHGPGLDRLDWDSPIGLSGRPR